MELVEKLIASFTQKIKMNYSVDKVAEFAEDLYTETVGIKHKNN